MEDPDFLVYGIDPSVPPLIREAAEKVDKAILQTIGTIGVYTDFGGRLFGLIRLLGSEAVRGRGEISVYRGGTPVSEMMMLTVERLRTFILGTGLVTVSEFEDYMTFYHDPDCTFRVLISGG